MLKTLESGIKVDYQQYYKLLEWKDKHMSSYLIFIYNNNIHGAAGINDLSQANYDKLVQYVETITNTIVKP